jgi:hypothetical protein
MRRTVLALAAAAALSACATPPADQAAAPAEGRDCFNASNASGFSYIDENHILVRVGASRRYILTTMFNARDLDWTQAIGLRSTTNWICTGNGLGVEVIGGTMHRRYPVTSIERAPEETPPAQGS